MFVVSGLGYLLYELLDEFVGIGELVVVFILWFGFWWCDYLSFCFGDVCEFVVDIVDDEDEECVLFCGIGDFLRVECCEIGFEEDYVWGGVWML